MGRAKVDPEAVRRRTCDEARVFQHTVAEAAPVLRPGWTNWERAPLRIADIQELLPAFMCCAVGTLQRPWSDYRAGTCVAQGWYQPTEWSTPVDTLVFITRPNKVPRAEGV